MYHLSVSFVLSGKGILSSANGCCSDNRIKGGWEKARKREGNSVALKGMPTIVLDKSWDSIEKQPFGFMYKTKWF